MWLAIWIVAMLAIPLLAGIYVWRQLQHDFAETASPSFEEPMHVATES